MTHKTNRGGEFNDSLITSDYSELFGEFI